MTGTYTDADLSSDAGRLAMWSAELRTAAEIGDTSHVAYLAQAIAIVATRVRDRLASPDYLSTTTNHPTPRTAPSVHD